MSHVRSGGKGAARKLYGTGQLKQFLGDYFAPAQHATDYERWLGAREPYSISGEYGYEPWGILDRYPHKGPTSGYHCHAQDLFKVFPGKYCTTNVP